MKVGRNDPCPCGSGKKYKHCCYGTDSEKHEEPEQAAASADEVAAESDESPATAKRRGREHPHGRQRFDGASRGGRNSFNPGQQRRGAQRGN